MDERDRFEDLLHVVDALAEANEETPILVEGQRDVSALRALGCGGVVLPVHNGRTLFALAEEVSRASPTVILLTDWDHKGGVLLDTLHANLTANGVRADVSYRDRLGATLSLRDVESLVGLVTRGLARFHRTTLDERRSARRLLG